MRNLGIPSVRLTLRVLLVFLAALPATAAAQTADSIVEAYIKARGGLAKIKSVQTERVTGTITLGADTEGKLIYERKRPLKMHVEIVVVGQTFIRTYDGKSSGWIYYPFTQNATVQPMSAADLASAADEADFEGPFVDYKAKGNQIEYVGKEEVEGKQASKVKLTSKQGEISYFLFDPSTNLLLKWEGTRKTKDPNTGADIEKSWQNFFRDFREVNGLKYPFLVESGAVDGSQSQKIVAEKIDVNIPIDDAEFGKPNPPGAAADPAKPAN